MLNKITKVIQNRKYQNKKYFFMADNYKIESNNRIKKTLKPWIETRSSK